MIRIANATLSLTDIDECQAAVCPPNMICINTEGGYNCHRPQGTIVNGSNCDCKHLISTRDG